MRAPLLRTLDWFLIAAVLAVFVWSGISPHDRLTWILEVFPAVFGTIALAIAWRRFRLTDLVLTCIALHMILLCVGGKYTYAEVPFGYWLQKVFDLTRNPYDRLGHFAQGFVPALIAREILLRRNVLAKPGWIPFLVVSICGAISAAYELVEWCAALTSHEAADSFLGVQGDIFDTQADMATAFLGAIVALVFFSRWHDRQMRSAEGIRS